MGETVLYIRMSDELKKQLEDYAKSKELSLSAAARLLLRDALAARGGTRNDPQAS